MKKPIILILLFFGVQLSAQDLWTTDNRQCFTMDLYSPEDFKNVKPVPNLKSPSGTFSVMDGYGPGCTNDCDIPSRMPLAGCTSPEYYSLPVVFRLNSNTCGGTGVSTQAEIDATLDATNAYFDCIGLPIRLSKCTTYDMSVLQPGAVVGADGSTVTEPYNCPYDGTDVTEIPNVMNVYVSDDTGNGTGCNGTAFLPLGSAPEIVTMSNACFSGFTNAVDCADLSTLGSSVVFIHEVGHYLGLYHTHETGNGATPDDPNTPADDCTTGDFISDTDEDPDYSAGELGFTGCNTGGAQPNCSFGNAGSAACSPYGTPNTLNNIMSYNNFQGCRQDLTDCQKAKMIDALTCYRNNSVCCDPAVTDNGDAASYMTETIQYVCAGDTPSAFTIDNPGGGAPALDANCIAWYDAMGNVLGNGTTFTPPTTGTGAFNNNTPGTYVYFFDDDANEYTVTDCDDQVLKQVTIIVLGDAGAGDSGGASTTITDCAAATNIPIDALGAALGSDANAIGWYFSTSDPTVTFTTSAAITGAISGAPAGNPAAPMDGDIFQSDTNDPETALSALTIDCATLGDGTYYMTPFIAYGEAPIICTQTSPTSSGGDYGAPFGGAGILFDPVGPLSCDGMGLPNMTWEVCVDITSAGTNMIVFSVNTPGGCGNIGFPGPTANCPTFPCQFCFQQSDFPAGFDPEVDDYCLAAADGNLGNAQGDIVYTATTTITYTGDDAYTIWDANGTPDIQASNGAESCFWGAPYEITCMCSVCGATASISTTNPTEACAVDGMVNICVDVDSGDPTEVTIDVGGVMATGAAGATQVCAALMLSANMGCAPLTQDYTVGATCASDNSVLVATSMESINIYPEALTIMTTDDGTSCGTPSVNLVAADNTTCATQTKAAVCADDNDSFDYDFATDAADDGYDGTWITTAPAACMPAVSSTINCSNCNNANCPTVTVVTNDDGVVCTGGGTDDLATWQTAVETDNPMGVVYSSVMPVAGTTPSDGMLPTGNHSASPGCAAEDQLVMAYVYCDVDASGTDNAGDTYSLVSAYTLTVYPIPDVINAAGGACSGMVTDNCGGLTILYSTDNFATPGTATPPSLNIGDADVTVNWTATIAGAPADCEAADVYMLTCTETTCPPSCANAGSLRGN